MAYNYRWVLYQDGVEISSSTVNSGDYWIDIPPNNERCHDVIYTVTCERWDGATAKTDIAISSCTCSCNNLCFWFDDEEKPSYCQRDTTEYSYHIISSKVGDDVICREGCTSPCSGDIVSFSAKCDNDGTVTMSGTWTVSRKTTGEIVYGPVTALQSYQLEENQTQTNKIYEIKYVGGCGEEASMEYTVLSGRTCEPCVDIETIDFQLPSGTLWGSINLDTCHEEDKGYYYAWGETNGYESRKFPLSSYTLYDKETEKFTKYNDVDKLAEFKIKQLD